MSLSKRQKALLLVLAFLAIVVCVLAIVRPRRKTGRQGTAVTQSSERPNVWAEAKVAGGASSRALAVLPFVNDSADSNQQYLPDGITDRLSAELESISSIRVTSPRSTLQYKDSKKKLIEIAKELEVSEVIQGTIKTFNDRLLISAQLVQPVSENTVWSKTFEVSQDDLSSIQQQIVSSIAEANLVRLTEQEASRLRSRPKVSGEAYTEYLLGRYELRQRTEQGFRAALEHFQKAIAIDPNFASAYSGAADSYSLLGNWGMLSPRESYPKAKSFVKRAIELDDSDAEAHASMGFIRDVYDWDPVGAEKEYWRAIELRPSYAPAHQWYALELASLGRLHDAFWEMDTARRLDPLTPIVQTHVGWIEYFARNYDEAIRQYQLVLQAAPEVNAARWRLGQAYIQKEMLTEAKNELRKSSSDPHALALLGYALAVSGETVEANRILAQLIKTSRTHYVPPVNMAIVCVGLRKTDTALEWLQRGVDDRDYWLTLLNVDPMFYEFRSDPRVTKLLNNVGLGTERK